MAEREIKRNSRGQIVSYEIYGALDSSIPSDSYGKASFDKKISGNRFATMVTKYDADSFDSYIDTTISDELISTDKEVSASPLLGFIADIQIASGPQNTSGN